MENRVLYPCNPCNPYNPCNPWLKKPPKPDCGCDALRTAFFALNQAASATPSQIHKCKTPTICINKTNTPPLNPPPTWMFSTPLFASITKGCSKKVNTPKYRLFRQKIAPIVAKTKSGNTQITLYVGKL